MKWTFTIPQATPSLNEIIGNHFRTNDRMKAVIKWMLASALNTIPKIPRATHKRRLTIVRHGRGRLDRANLVGGAKWLEDAIKDRGLLTDDDDAGCELIVTQIVSRKDKPFTEVTIEDMEAA
jgi:hypothetical protein